MRHILRILSVFLAISLASFAAANETVPREPDIEATISAQFDAFLDDDFARAFTYASPNIQSLFGTSERFGDMVQNGYPMVWRPVDIRYLDLRDVAGNLWQRVMIRDQSGGIHLLDYQMIQTSEGWRINSVQLLRAVGATA